MGGFNNVTFKGIDEGNDKKLSSTGGNGGYDPSFQVFERAFSISFENNLEKVQTRLRAGMPSKSRELIKYMLDNTMIKEYCQLTPKMSEHFNSVIRSYTYFLKNHSALIRNFLLKFTPEEKKAEATGMGGVQVNMILERYKIVESQMIKGL